MRRGFGFHDRHSPFRFNPATLFGGGAQGAWYDPSDLSTLFQDAAGTVPVASIGDPVGRISDKSGNGNHATQSTAASRPLLQQTAGLYHLTFDGANDSLSTAASIPFATVTSDGQARRNLLNYPTQFDAAPANGWLVLNNTSVSANATAAPDGTTEADKYVSAPAATGSVAQEIFQGVAVTAAEHTFSVYAKAAGFSFLQFNNSQIAAFANFDLSTGTVGTTGGGVSASIQDVGNGWYRCVGAFPAFSAATVNFRCSIVPASTSPRRTTMTGDGTSGIFLWGAQLEIGSTATAFQNIGTDKLTVWSGLLKSSDAAQGVVAELSADISSNNGAFLLSAPNSAAANYNWSSKGTTQVDNTVTTYAAPHTAVLTGIANIGAPSNILRVNGVQAGSVVTTQGTRSFESYALNIGRRNNSSLPFNGRLYGLIVFGAAASDWQIAAAERWMAQRTGILII